MLTLLQVSPSPSLLCSPLTTLPPKLLVFTKLLFVSMGHTSMFFISNTVSVLTKKIALQIKHTQIRESGFEIPYNTSHLVPQLFMEGVGCARYSMRSSGRPAVHQGKADLLLP